MSKPGKLKLPKTIAGIKVPKSLRQAGWLEGLVGSEAGRELLAQAILKAAEAAADVLRTYEQPADEATSEASQGDGADREGADPAAANDEAPSRPSRGRRRTRATSGVDPGTGEPDQAAASVRS